jgi:hypothetical protein
MPGNGEELLLGFLKKVVFWNYARNTWQWDALCVVILIFIFLTPKSWFDKSERKGVLAHQNPAAKIVLVSPEVVDKPQDTENIERYLRQLKGRHDLEVLGVRTLTDESGKITGYEVDIR